MDKEITAILTGDIVNSRSIDPNSWQTGLKQLLDEFGPSPKVWEIYRGDAFQVEVPAELALLSAIRIKALIKQNKHLDVRIAIGIGTKDFPKSSITESNGEAYTNSGRCFEALKKKRLAVSSPWKNLDSEWNLYFQLASLVMDQWAPKTAYILKAALDHPEFNQMELAELLDRSQSTVSEGLKRAGFDEIEKLLQRYAKQIPQKGTSL